MTEKKPASPGTRTEVARSPTVYALKRLSLPKIDIGCAGGWQSPVRPTRPGGVTLRSGASDQRLRDGHARVLDDRPPRRAAARPGRVLDAGCGNAELAELIAAPEVVCVDASPAAVEQARSRGLRG